MTKPTTPRHSKQSKPVTIDLEAENVTRSEEGSDGKDEVSATAPQSPPSSEDRSAPPKAETEPKDEKSGKAEADNAGGADKSAASGLGMGSVSDVKKDGPTTDDGKPSAASTAASGLAASQTDKAGESSSGKGNATFDGKPTTGSAMGSASSAAAASASAKPTSGPGTAASSARKDSATTSAKSSGQKSGGSGGGAIVGGVIGAALGIAALFGLQAANMLPAPGASSDGTETASLENEISTLRASLDELRSSVAAAPGTSDNSDITSRLDALEASSGSTDGGSALSELSTRLDQISEKVDGLTGSGGDTSGIREEIAGLSGRVDDMSGNVSDLQTKLGELSGRIDGIEKGQSDLSDSLTGRIEKAEKAIEEPGRELEMAKAIAVSGLKSAVDRGGSFAPELEAFASVAPDNPAVAKLREFAASGVPTQGELVERFPDAANAMIEAMDPISENAGIFDRLAASAKSMVKVRKVGDVEGDSTEAIAARLEYQLKNGNLDAAVGEWEALPEKAKAAAPEFGQGLKARAEVEKLLTEVQLPAVAASQTEMAPKPAEEAAPPASTEQAAPEAEAQPETQTDGSSDGGADAPAETPAQSE